MLRLTFFIVTLFLPALAAAQQKVAYHWHREVELPKLTATTPIGIPLDSHFFQATRDGWPDVRLRGTGDEAIAFLIRARHDVKTRTRRQNWAAEQTSAKVDTSAGMQIELALREKEPLPQGIRIVTPLKNFEHQVVVESSVDGQTWTSAGKPTLIFDYSSYVDARNVLIPIDPGQHRRFRLTVEDITAEQESQLLELHRRLSGSDEVDRTERITVSRRPFRVDRIEFYRDESRSESSDLQTTKYPIAKFVMTEDSKVHQTILTFETQREPITEIKIVTQAENFSRAAAVKIEREDANGKKDWQTLSIGGLVRISIGAIQQEDLTLTIPETRADHFRIVIENGDSPPVLIQAVELSGPLYELAFLASPSQKISAEYGSLSATAGQYDTAALKAALSEGQSLVNASWLSPIENEHVSTDGKAEWKPWNDTRILFAGIIGLTLLLGWGLFRASQRIELPPPEE